MSLINEHKLKNHPSLIHVDRIIDLCRPLKDKLDLDYFAHVNVDTNGDFTVLSRNAYFIEHYLKQDYYNVDVHLSDHQLSEEFVIQDLNQHQGKTGSLFVDCREFGLNHIFTIIQRNNNMVDAFHFAISKVNSNINAAYLANIHFLRDFSRDFKASALSDKVLSKAYQNKFSINFADEGYRTEADLLIKDKIFEESLKQLSKRIYIPGSKTQYLTLREAECLLWLHYGKTCEEIAVILNASTRTVRAHVNNAKEKLNCHTLFQLGEMLSSLNLPTSLIK